MAPKITFGTLYRTDGYGADLKQFARAVEAQGWDDIWINETVLGRFPHADALSALAAVAGCTERLRIGTAILLLPLHHPILVAKAIGSIDVISGGRVTLGIGVGGEWTKSFEALGVPVSERGARTNEAIEIIRKLWSGETVSHRGRFFQFEDVELLPPPVQRPHPPIWVGGRPDKEGVGSASQRRTALMSDGWLPYLVTPDMYRRGWETIARLASEAGRDPEGIERGVVVMMSIAGSRDEARRLAADEHFRAYGQRNEETVERYDVFGTPADCIKGLERYVEAGARRIVIQWRCPLGSTAENVAEAARSILPYFR